MERIILTWSRAAVGVALVAMLAISCTFQSKPVEVPLQQQLANPASESARLPRLVPMPEKSSTLMSWVEPLNGGHVLKFAVLEEGKWVKQGLASQGQNWFVNWADYPSVTPISNTFWVAHWLSRKQGGKTYEYDISLAITNDAGKTWQEIGHPHRDGAAAEHGFVTLFRESEQVAGIIWLDGREYIKKGKSGQTAGKSGNFALRYTRIHADGSMDDEQVIDDNTCTCCWTSVAQTPAGAIAVWRGRTEAEVRDNRYGLLSKGQWTIPKGLGGEGWQIDACPVNGPSVASRGRQVVASWFTAQGDNPRVRIAFSGDSGKSFGNSLDVDDIAPIGRIGLVWLDRQYAVVSWLGRADENLRASDLYVRLVSKKGEMYAPQRIATLSSGRDAGVPQMSYNGRELVFAWTKPAPEHGIATMLLPKRGLSREQQVAETDVKHLAQGLASYNTSICTRQH